MATYKELTAEELRHIRKSLIEAAEGYGRIAEQMDAMAVDTIVMAGLPTLRTSIIRVLGNVTSAQRGLNKVAAASAVPESHVDAVVQRSAPESKKKLGRKRKANEK